MRNGASSAASRLERYVACLRSGLDGYPGAQAKGSLVRSVLAGQSVGDLLPRLPPAVREVAADPPMGSDWIPETYFAAIFLAVADLRGLSDDGVLAWSRAQNRVLLASPVYRILMSVGSPAAMVRHAGVRWSNWHRGTSLAFDGFSDDGARVTLAFPAGLYDGLLLRAFAQGFAAALEMAHATDPVVRVESEGPGFARYVARW